MKIDGMSVQRESTSLFQEKSLNCIRWEMNNMKQLWLELIREQIIKCDGENDDLYYIWKELQEYIRNAVSDDR